MSTGKLIGAGIVSAIAASLCCITPVLALIAGGGSFASSFSWMEPARPYLIGLTIAVLGFAWHLKLKPQPADDCGCGAGERPKFLHSKTFLLIVSLVAALMIGFPSYAKIFFPKNKNAVIVVDKANIQTIEIDIKGMSCIACEEEINHEINKLQGIVESTVSYKNRSAVIKFDVSKTTIKDITDAVNATGYKVTSQLFKN